MNQTTLKKNIDCKNDFHSEIASEEMPSNTELNKRF